MAWRFTWVCECTKKRRERLEMGFLTFAVRPRVSHSAIQPAHAFPVATRAAASVEIVHDNEARAKMHESGGMPVDVSALPRSDRP